jgi:BirA family transcriptional regulator, biotin operon repressor / biotin---[acetyl-CoA-carboxylase] ligase
MRIGQKLIHLESVDSTNNYTANLLKAGGLSSGTVILADEQFAGKGQRGAEWLAEAGKNLTFSIYVEEVNLSVENQFDLSKMVALSLTTLLKKIGISAQIKWPNDIWVNGRKISGVLIENTISQSRGISSIIGIGLNVNQTEFGTLNATSVQREKGNFVPTRDVLFSYLESFNSLYDWFSIRPELLHQAYLEQLYQLNEMRTYRDESGTFEGKIIGVEKSGRLIVLKNDIPQSYDLKEIAFL